VKYFGGRNRSKFERFWWAIIFVASLTISSILINNIYRKWDESPVLFSLSNTPTHDYEIPFPAVTICPQSKSRISQFNFSDVYHKRKNGDLLNQNE
jgi:amiloride-sensitive sodium channel